MAITKYDLDINKQAIIKPVVILRQGDHDIDTMHVSLSVANEPMDLTGATVTFMGNTANGRQIVDDAHLKIIDAKGGLFEYVFPSEAASDIGEYKVAYFSIILANGQSSTMDFRVQVLSGVDISAPAASEYVSHYDTMVASLNSAYDSFVNETDDKMASVVSSVADSAGAVLDSALAHVADVDSQANHASSVATNAVSMASSVATDVTSQANYINSVASSASADVGRALDKINNMSVGGRNLLLDTGRSFTGVGANQDDGSFDGQNGKFYLAGGKKVSDLYKQYGPSRYLTLSFDWVADGSTISGHFKPQWYGAPWNSGITDEVYPSTTNKSGHYKTSISLTSDGYSTGEANSIQFRQDYLQGNITIKNLKLEAGNIATDWTPAPEDADNTFLKKSGGTMTGDLLFNETSGIRQAEHGLGIVLEGGRVNAQVIPESVTDLNDMIYQGEWFTASNNQNLSLANNPAVYTNGTPLMKTLYGTQYNFLIHLKVKSNVSYGKARNWGRAIQEVTAYSTNGTPQFSAVREGGNENGTDQPFTWGDWQVTSLRQIKGSFDPVAGSAGNWADGKYNWTLVGNMLRISKTGNYNFTQTWNTGEDKQVSGVMVVLRDLMSGVDTTTSAWTQTWHQGGNAPLQRASFVNNGTITVHSGGTNASGSSTWSVLSFCEPLSITVPSVNPATRLFPSSWSNEQIANA